MNILVVEDDERLAGHLAQVLNAEGFAHDLAMTLEAAGILLEVNAYDCVVLDINLPDGNGFTLVKKMRSQGDKLPIIIVTARGQVDERIKGLNLGADDYIPKPVDANELIARIRAVIRRHGGKAVPDHVCGALTVKPAEHIALIADQPLDLTAKEFGVLEFMAQHSGQVVTRTMLMEHVWGSDFDSFSNVIDVYVRNLRRKMEKLGEDSLIQTIRGKGYILVDDES